MVSQGTQASALTSYEQDRLSHESQATATTLANVTMYHSNPYRALTERVRNSASTPAVTFYNGAERIELSYKSLDNWVAKTSNFLLDEIEVREADSFYLDLPAHWLKVVWLLAIWATGCQIAPTRDAALHTVSSEPTTGDDIYCSLQVMGKPPEAPVGFIDFITEVRKFGDFFASPGKSTEIDYEMRWRVPELSRILIVGADFSTEQIAAAFDTKSSLVILHRADENLRATVTRDEKVTCTWE